MEKKVSSKQIEANRVNGLKGGVKTEEGKCIVSKNALTHGLTTNMMIDQEERDEYEAIFEALKEELSPESLLEGMIIERIALAYTKLQRVAKLYNNQIVIDGLEREADYLQDMKPERKLVFENFEMFDKSDQNKEKEILEIEQKIHTIKTKIEQMKVGSVGYSSIDTIEKFQRYETSIENRLYKSIREYNKLKAMKSGAPIIDVNIEG